MHKLTTTEGMAGAFLVALAIVLMVRVGAPPGNKLEIALRLTARWSFVLFWLGYAGNALATVFGSKFQALARRGRDFGLAFASAHLVHLGLVAWFLYTSTTPFPRFPLVFLSVAVLWIYVLAILSMRRISARLNPRTWRIVRTVGVEFIALAFLLDFAKNPFQGGVVNLIAYLPFLTLLGAGLLLRLAALAKHPLRIGAM